jgi:hypothetical protein
MNHPTDIPLCESLDAIAWDPNEVRDLVRTTPLRFDDSDQPAGYIRLSRAPTCSITTASRRFQHGRDPAS